MRTRRPGERLGNDPWSGGNPTSLSTRKVALRLIALQPFELLKLLLQLAEGRSVPDRVCDSDIPHQVWTGDSGYVVKRALI